MNIDELKKEDVLKKNFIMFLAYGLAASLGFLAQIALKAELGILVSIGVPLLIVLIVYVLSKKVHIITVAFPYILLLAAGNAHCCMGSKY